MRSCYLAWRSPAPENAIAHLTTTWHTAPLDLGGQLIVVPSRQAGRRLRERLAQVTAAKGGCVLSARVITPSELFRPLPEERPLVDAATALLAWREALKMAGPSDVKGFLPRGDMPKDDASLFGLAEQLVQLRELLCEEGYTIATFHEQYEQNPESERWACLAALERRYYAVLGKNGLRDNCQVKIEAAESGQVPEGIKLIRVMFCPDLPRLAIRMLERMPDSVTVEINIHAPDSLRDHFDEWGRPIPAKWENYRFSIGDEQIHRFQSRAGEVAFVADHLKSLAQEKRSLVAVGVPDIESVPYLRCKLNEHAVASYDPAGTVMATTSLFGFLDVLGSFLERDDYGTFSGLARHPYLTNYLGRVVPSFDLCRYLEDLDTFQNDHLPSDFASALALLSQPCAKSRHDHEPLRGAFEAIKAWAEPLLSAGCSHALLSQLGALFDGVHVSKRDPSDAAFMDVAREVTATALALGTSTLGSGLQSATLIRLITRLLSKKKVSGERPPDAVDLLGWLELHWEDAPVLMITGMTNEAVPECLIGHPFLPDSARSVMHMRDNASRYARDAYLLAALCASREPGSVSFSFSKTDDAGDPRKPSRLLLMCDEDRLVGRTDYLFGKLDEKVETCHKINRWQYEEPFTGLPENLQGKLSVSNLMAYLACPFLFYLQTVRKMTPLDDTKQELDSLDFGNICHKALELFGKPENSSRDSHDEKVIADFLVGEADRLIQQVYGNKLSAPLLIQRDSVRQRLRASARVQAGIRKEGWRIQAVETKLTMEICGIKLRATIDRVDVHEETGGVRIMDYKTSDSPLDLQAALKPLSAPKKPKTFTELCEAPGKAGLLQLPLYALIYGENHTGSRGNISCAYFNLPRSVQQSGLEVWNDFHDDIIKEARSIAEDIIGNIQACRFSEIRTKKWPPEYARMFQSPKVSVSFEGGMMRIES